MDDKDEFRHTGIWPFSMFPSGWGALRPTGSKSAGQQTASAAKIFDPVALAWTAGPKLITSGWVGIEIMPRKLLWEIVDAPADGVDKLAESWVAGHRPAIADAFTERLVTYTVDQQARDAMDQAIDAYRRGHYMATVRTLMPEVERFGRMVASPDGTLPKNQKEAAAAITAYLGQVPVSDFDPIESLTIYPIIAGDLFAKCFTAADAQQLSTGLNRHAELHGLATYGDLRGATKMLSVFDFLLHAVTDATASAHQTGPASR